MSDGDPRCHLCYGRGESQGRGQTHPCICLHWRIRALTDGVAKLGADLIALRAENERLKTVISRLSEWTHTFGAELKPRRADTYGEGVRDSKERVARILESAPSEGEGANRG